MSNNDEALQLESTFVVVDPTLRTEVHAVTDRFWAGLDARYGSFAGHTLISSFRFDTDWPTWEMHPKGDEVVCLLNGDADLVFATGSGEKSVRLRQPGSFIIVPQGTWHTARIHAPTTMLFVTPGEGTENRETPGNRQEEA
jgi:mannose-6-phosphate isomerase-like protein (cupin superfamily)